MLIAVGMFCFAETKLKPDILSSVIVGIKAEYVQTFRWKRIWSRNTRVWTGWKKNPHPTGVLRQPRRKKPPRRYTMQSERDMHQAVASRFTSAPAEAAPKAEGFDGGGDVELF